MLRVRAMLAVTVAFACASCGEGGSTTTIVASAPTPTPTPTPTPAPKPITGLTQSSTLATFANPWAIKVEPDGRVLVTQRTNPGAISVVSQAGIVTPVSGLPTNIGVLDVELAPDFSSSKQIYFSYMAQDLSAPRIGRAKDDPCCVPERLTVARATLVESGAAESLAAVQVVYKQQVAVTTYAGSGEPGGRIAFSPDGRYVFVTVGDRQELDTTILQHLSNDVGVTVRLFRDGSIPPDNPFVATAGARPEIWTWGHRNPYGLVFSPDGRLWSSEMGPLGGDELNVLLSGKNYGWPLASNGDNYDGSVIPDHTPGDGFEAPKISWTPVIAPGGMLFYKGNEFADWRGDLLLTGLASQAIVRVRLAADTAQEVQRIPMGARIRDIAEAPDGSLWIITDGAAGALRRITPVF